MTIRTLVFCDISCIFFIFFHIFSISEDSLLYVILLKFIFTIFQNIKKVLLILVSELIVESNSGTENQPIKQPF